MFLFDGVIRCLAVNIRAMNGKAIAQIIETIIMKLLMLVNGIFLLKD